MRTSGSLDAQSARNHRRNDGASVQGLGLPGVISPFYPIGFQGGYNKPDGQTDSDSLGKQ